MVSFYSYLHSGGYQFRYYDLEMTKDDGNFLLKALEVVGTAEKDGTHSLIVSSNQRFNLNPRAYVIRPKF